MRLRPIRLLAISAALVVGFADQAQAGRRWCRRHCAPVCVRPCCFWQGPSGYLPACGSPVWSREGTSIFFHDFAQDGEPIYKLNIANDRRQRIADLRDLRSGDFVDYRFAGLTPADLPLVNARMSTANIYSAELPER